VIRRVQNIYYLLSLGECYREATKEKASTRLAIFVKPKWALFNLMTGPIYLGVVYSALGPL
jgi:hypothetical protein